MKRRILPVLLVILAALTCIACAAGAEAVKITGAESVTLRSSANGTVVARFYQGVPAERLETKGKWSRVRIGEDPVSVTGWIPNENLAPVEPGEFIYCGLDCVPAQGQEAVLLLEDRKSNAPVLGVWDGTNGDTYYTVAGVFSGSEWLMVTRTGEENLTEWFFAAGSSLATFDGVYVRSRAADSVVSLRAEPNTKAKILVSCFGGVPADVLFDFEMTDGWTRICVGGTAGYMMNDFLEEMEFDVPAYRPPLASLKTRMVSVYAEPAGNVLLSGAETLTAGSRFCVLGRAKTRHLIRIDGGGNGMKYRYGWIDETDLASTALTGGSTKGTLLRDTSVLNWDGETCRVLKAGQEVTFRWFYDVFPGETDGNTAVLDYCDPNTSSWIWIDAATWSYAEEGESGEAEFIEEWGIGFIPADAVQMDRNLILPAAAGG